MQKEYHLGINAGSDVKGTYLGCDWVTSASVMEWLPAEWGGWCSWPVR